MTDDRETMPPMPADDEATAFSRVEGKLDRVLEMLATFFERQQEQDARIRDIDGRVEFLERLHRDTEPAGKADG